MRERIELGIGYVPSDRHRYGLIMSMKLTENMFLKSSFERTWVKHALIDRKKLDAYTGEQIRAYDVKATGPEAVARSLSGGNQQKVILAREVDMGRAVIVFDQPTRGLDLGAIEHIHRTILNEKKKGKAIVLISTELSEIFALSDRIAVIYKGEIVGIYHNHDLDTQKIGLLMAGYTPERTRHCQALNQALHRNEVSTDSRDLLVTNVLAVLAGLAVSGLLLLFLGENPLDAMGTLFGSLFRDSYTFADVFVKATPLMFTALAFALPFQANLFNIGAQGQFYIGAITAVGCSLLLQGKLPGPLVLVIAAGHVHPVRRAVGRDDRLAESQVQRQ